MGFISFSFFLFLYAISLFKPRQRLTAIAIGERDGGMSRSGNGMMMRLDACREKSRDRIKNRSVEKLPPGKGEVLAEFTE